MIKNCAAPTTQHNTTYILSAIIVAIVVSVAVAKFRKDNVNYLNSDATWHALLTMKCYDETPAKIHKFLPIVSLGNADDKWISWGATIPDKNGNFYYTSFSPAGYFIPYAFIKIFHLDICEKSLYVFNSIFFALSAVLLFFFLLTIFYATEFKYFISFCGVLCYIFSPEILHGMGIVYWHQSLMQATLLLQTFCFFCRKDKKSKLLFYVLCVANPYIEWTGYVANAGFATAEFISTISADRKKAVRAVSKICILTVLAFCIFSFHYLLAVSPKDFFLALKNRFFGRNFTTKVPFSLLAIGYLHSFCNFWIFLAILLVCCIVQNGKIIFEKRLVLFVLFFPVVENLIMLQHAVAYTYDRMKAIFPIVFLICLLLKNILENAKFAKPTKILIFTVLVLICSSSFYSYKKDVSYIWKADYRVSNRKFADFINDKYSDSIIFVKNSRVRGYVNLLFGRGIYEFFSLDKAKQICKKKGKRYVIYLQLKNRPWDMLEFTSAQILDVKKNKNYTVKIKNNQIIKP